MKRNHKIHIFIIASIMTVCVGLFGAYQLYQNGKTDGFNSGWIEVRQCREMNTAWRIYECRGDYTSNVGMMGKRDVSVRVTGYEPRAGDMIDDVYPPTFHKKMETSYFITGKERNGIVYNSPWLIMVFISIFLPLSFAVYVLGVRSGLKRR